MSERPYLQAISRTSARGERGQTHACSASGEDVAELGGAFKVTTASSRIWGTEREGHAAAGGGESGIVVRIGAAVVGMRPGVRDAVTRTS